MCVCVCVSELCVCVCVKCVIMYTYILADYAGTHPVVFPMDHVEC